MSCNLATGDDSNNFFAFLHEFREKIGSDKMITLAVRATPFTDTDGDLSDLAEDVDYIGENLFDRYASLIDNSWYGIAIMDYDIWGSWSPTTGPNAPLDDSCAATKAGSATSSIQQWTATNFPASKVGLRVCPVIIYIKIPRVKIVLGVPAYGHGFNVSSATALLANNSIAVYSTFTGIPYGPNDDPSAPPQREFRFFQCRTMHWF